MAPMVDMPRKEVPPPLELVKGRIEELMPPDAKGEIDSGEAVVIDVREAERFDKGHLDGAINLSSGESAREAHGESYAEAIAEAAGGRDKRVILVCGEGNRSARTADALGNEHGFERVASVIGGIKLWNDLGYPVEGEIVVGADDAELGEAMEGDTT
jgi:rhodanese-related sulfurtransferase